MKPPPPPPRYVGRPETWQDKLRRRVMPVVEYVQPVTKVAERIASLAVHVQAPTILGTLGMASAAVNAVRDLAGHDHHMSTGGTFIALMATRTMVIRAFEAAGGIVTSPATNQEIKISVHGVEFRITDSGYLVSPNSDRAMLGWVADALGCSLPPVLRIGPSSGPDVAFSCAEADLTELRSARGAEIAEATRPMLGERRCILLTGRPGVGKTTMAQEIAKLLDLGRVLIIDANAITGNPDAPTSGGGRRPSDPIRLLRAAVIVVDDIDKVHLSIYALEALRESCRLLILTANNGEHDEVLDAAMVRPDRIDEAFEIKADTAPRRPPFDMLTDADWEEVRDWPVAFLNEVELRLRLRPGEVRLDDLRGRLNRRTFSKGGLY